MSILNMTDSLVVVPGQVIAAATVTVRRKHGDEDTDTPVDDTDETANNVSFLRGHGTYIERVSLDDDEDGHMISSPIANIVKQEVRLIASVTGIVHRVNKLVSVESIASQTYVGHVGDLVVGRIVSANTASGRWNVQLAPHLKQASLPLSGVHLPGGVQRIRTAQDALQMTDYLRPGDLVSAEVHKVQQQSSTVLGGGGGAGGGTLVLHTRSVKYGKLENGVCVDIPPLLVPRRKNHAVTLALPTASHETSMGSFLLLLGCNGMIWIQRQLPDNTTNTNAIGSGSEDLHELQEAKRQVHATTMTSVADRQAITRIRNCILALRMTQCYVTPERIEDLYHKSLFGCQEPDATIAPIAKPSEILQPDNVIGLTKSLLRL